MRRFGSAAVRLWPALVLVVFLAAPLAAPTRAQDATPEAATPAAPPVVATAPADPTAPPETPPPPPAAASTDVVALVAWYTLSPSGNFLSLFPLQTEPGQPATSTGDPIGRADFPAEAPPTVILGDTSFQGFLRFEGDVNNGLRWTWFDDAEGARPATLVFQIQAIDGTYRDYVGTATFVSRDDGSAGGVVVLTLRPPGAAAEAPAPAESAEEPPAAEAVEEAAPAAPAAPATPDAAT